MAILKFKTGGRPLILDTERLAREFQARLPRARQSLKEFRKTTSGVREEELLGTETSLPEWLDASIMALIGFGEKITLETAREIKQAFQTVKKLSSQRISTRETALESQITREYLQSLRDIQKVSTGEAKKSYQRIEEYIKGVTKKERIEFYKSRAYQDVGSFRGRRYKRIKEWASNSAGKNLSYKESYAYLIANRLEQSLNVGELSELVDNSSDVLFGE